MSSETISIVYYNSVTEQTLIVHRVDNEGEKQRFYCQCEIILLNMNA